MLKSAPATCMTMERRAAPSPLRTPDMTDPAMTKKLPAKIGIP